MRQNMSNGERMLSIIGGLAFAGLGMSSKLRGSMCGKALAFMGVKAAVLGIAGYNPLLDFIDQ
ncbi:putative membrane protein [Desulfohalotomaculum tongense]|uniref:YgaP-like transmembrane domain n=1 Tax=Desulforadius tongensis TaxID=1216062 RepID=UPI0019568D5A|nr:YgaP-like transmembrane domain [Desulforadius tongensis]MBM7855907.1 putative membrane protein [Desulforadius tongensis]